MPFKMHKIVFLFLINIFFSRKKICVPTLPYLKFQTGYPKHNYFYTPRKLCLWWVYCFHVVRPCVRAFVRNVLFPVYLEESLLDLNQTLQTCSYRAFVYALMVPSLVDQLLPQLLMEPFDTLPIQCRHIEHMHKGVWFRRNNF